jgi:hypothetical protein
MSSTDSVVVSTVVAVDPATAFGVFTDEVDVWWKTGPRYRWSLDRPGKVRFEGGQGGRLVEVYAEGEPFEIGRVLAWEPSKRLIFELQGRNREQSEVEVRFEGVEQGTRVTVEHRGFDAIPVDHPARHGLVGEAFSSMMGLWWADLMVALNDHLKAR